MDHVHYKAVKATVSIGRSSHLSAVHHPRMYRTAVQCFQFVTGGKTKEETQVYSFQHSEPEVA